MAVAHGGGPFGAVDVGVALASHGGDLATLAGGAPPAVGTRWAGPGPAAEAAEGALADAGAEAGRALPLRTMSAHAMGRRQLPKRNYAALPQLKPQTQRTSFKL